MHEPLEPGMWRSQARFTRTTRGLVPVRQSAASIGVLLLSVWPLGDMFLVLPLRGRFQYGL